MTRQTVILGALFLLACPGDLTPQQDGPSLVDRGSAGQEPGKTVDGQPATADGKAKSDLKPKTDTGVKQDVKPAADAWTGSSDIGKPCTSNGQCQFGFCATNTHTGVQFCTKVCDPCASSPCPAGSGCQDAGLAFICAPGYPNAPCQ